MVTGTPLARNQEVLSYFAPVEGQVAFYYGKIRNGKTYAATADILELLQRGEVVYANWKINFEGYDQRDSAFVVFFKILTGRKVFFRFDSSNFHFFSPDDIDVPFLGRLVGVHIFIDEGQWLFNSHIKNHDPETRKLILHNGHYCRSLNIISQRPMNVMKDMRSQIDYWYKCEKRSILGFVWFQKTLFQDMKDDMPDEELPSGRPKVYRPDARVFAAYNTHGMRGVDAIDDGTVFEAYSLSLTQKIVLLSDLIAEKFSPKLRRARVSAHAPLGEISATTDVSAPQGSIDERAQKVSEGSITGLNKWGKRVVGMEIQGH